MLETIAGGIVVGLLGAMAFVAYNHPKTYNYVAYGVLIITAAMILATLVGQLKEKETIANVKALAELSAEQKAMVIEAVTAQPKNARLYGWVFWAFYWYAGFLWVMPLFGLSADQRERPKRRYESL